MIGGILRGVLSAQLRQHSQKMTSILRKRRLDFGSGAYCSSAGDLVPRSSGITSKWQVAKKKWEKIADKIAKIDDFDWVPDKQDILVSPLTQVFSIYICGGHSRPSEIYGRIEANEEEGSNFTLYDRGRDNYETISSNQGNLSLIGPEYCALLCRNVTTLNLHLKDRRQGMDIISSRFILHSNKDDEIDASCDKLVKAVVQGEHGFTAHLYYTTFRYAAFGCVSIGLVEKYDKSCDLADIYGSIVAGYAPPKPCYANNDDLEYMKTVLFNEPPHKTLRAVVPSVSPIPLSRTVVAVPAYGRLKIELDLRESGVQFAAGCVEFDALPWGQFVRFVVGDLGVVSIEVSWKERVVTSKDQIALKGSVDVVFPQYLRSLKKNGFPWLGV